MNDTYYAAAIREAATRPAPTSNRDEYIAAQIQAAQSAPAPTSNRRVTSNVVDTPRREAFRLEFFAWLLDWDDQPRHRGRLSVLWQWADEMVRLQAQADQSGSPVEYVQRGNVVRVLHPMTEAAA